MYTKFFIASVVGMAAVKRIKNENIRASIGIPLVALMMFFLLSMSVQAQWKPDRAEYNVLSDRNFHTTAHDMNTALSIALSTLKYNGAKMHTVDVDHDEIDAPLFSHFHRDNQESFVYVCYVARTKTGYVIWFRFLPNERVEFTEDYIILEYAG